MNKRKERNLRKHWGHQLRRKDFSPFLIHLCREYDGISSTRNLTNILLTKKIEARNFHNLFNQEIESSNFNDELKSSFNSVSFTEIPIPYLKKVTRNIKGRNIELEPVGLVFDKAKLLLKDVTPVIYINTCQTDWGYQWHGKHPSLKFWKQAFRQDFQDITSWEEFDKKHTKTTHPWELLKRYALVSKIDEKYDFSWEREWKHIGDFEFSFKELAAILVKNPKKTADKMKKYSKRKSSEYHELAQNILEIPLISLNSRISKLIETVEHLWTKFH